MLYPDINALLIPYVGLAAIVLAVLLLLLLALLIWQMVRLRRLEQHYNNLLSGVDGALANGGNLQNVLDSHVGEVRSALVQVGELDRRTQRFEQDSRPHIQHLGLVRFNPFREPAATRASSWRSSTPMGMGPSSTACTVATRRAFTPSP